MKTSLTALIIQKTHKCYFDENKRVIGKFKDELAGVSIQEFVGLRSKMYSLKIGNREIKRCKGMKRSVVSKDITFNNYKTTLENNSELLHKMVVIRSENHNIKTVKINKISLSCYDDKKYILTDGIESLPYGHKDINDS